MALYSAESCGKSMETNVAHTSILMVLALFPWEAGLFSSAPEEMATTRWASKTGRNEFLCPPQLQAVHLAGSWGLGSSQGTKLTCLLVPGHTGVAESLSRLQIKPLMICNPTTDLLGCQLLGPAIKTPEVRRRMPVTVSHRLDADTVGVPGGCVGALTREGSQGTVRASLWAPGPGHSSC